MNDRLFTFIGGNTGGWRVASIQAVIGESLSVVSRIAVVSGEIKQLPTDAKWLLRGITSNERYVVRSEQEQLLAKHVQIGLQYLPAVARRLHHCRDLGENEPFDFLTWFEYAPLDEGNFNRLVAELRGSAEWKYVDREIDIRLVREQA